MASVLSYARLNKPVAVWLFSVSRASSHGLGPNSGQFWLTMYIIFSLKGRKSLFFLV